MCLLSVARLVGSGKLACPCPTPAVRKQLSASAGCLAWQVGRLVGSGKLAQHSIIKVENGTANMMEDGMRLLILGVEVLGAHEGPVGGAQAAIKKEDAAAVKDEPMPVNA